ncbi:ABC transporter ATP-binding protein [Halomonas stenophila]|uniref:Iron(III) transport system ATP-binding protein n=1 Tax=Halomonas stenophila TaxID=795312 RepID=A0A7W5EVF2_9GAMM|nr:ABC transporter ATP-binding protein [Halomonas stenophila]MBB3231772.1 iron(III) transport system ATP-binding protein [Halomonas stenophila]
MTSQQPSFTAGQVAPGRAPVLAMHNIRHAYGHHLAVEDVGLEVRQGEVVCLLGPSGCGKTTLLRIVAGLEVLQRGRVDLNGQAIGRPGRGHVPPEKRNVGLAFQDSALFPHLSVLENVTFGLESLPGRQRRRRAMELLDQLGMGRYAESYPHTLSGGQQQRVALARALAPAPQLMLLDEPFSSLDARLRDRIRDDTLHVLKRVGSGALLVTHDPEEAMFMADRIALMRDGHIVQMGTPRELYCAPVDPFVVSFFGEVNELEGVVRQGRVDTPVGEVMAPGLPDGSRVRVMIRPEALRVVALDEPPADHHSHVIMAKLLGRTSLLHICAHAGGGRESHLHARVPGVFLPDEGQPVTIRLDPSQVFVFPADPGAAAGAGAAHGEAEQDHREYAYGHDGQ